MTVALGNLINIIGIREDKSGHLLINIELLLEIKQWMNDAQ